MRIVSFGNWFDWRREACRCRSMSRIERARKTSHWLIGLSRPRRLRRDVACHFGADANDSVVVVAVVAADSGDDGGCVSVACRILRCSRCSTSV